MLSGTEPGDNVERRRAAGGSPEELSPAHPQRVERESRLLSREGVFCAALVAFSILLIWPAAQIGIEDDPVYTLTALDFARTGHFIFHSWAAPILGWQAMWGALFAKVFGATFTAVRLSIAPVAVFSALLYHAILRRFGINTSHATFGTLAFVLGPAFLALSVTFMTDVPGIFALLVCLYLCQRALDAGSDARTIFFLALASLTNVALGSARQIAWLGVLVMMPSCVWLLRRRRSVVWAGAGLWIISTICIHLMSAWYARQPYTSPEGLIPGELHMQLVGYAVGQLVRLGMTVLLFLLPVLVLGVAAVWPFRRRFVAGTSAIILVLACWMVLLHRRQQAHILAFPWVPLTFGKHGFLPDALLQARPPLPLIGELLLLLLVVVSVVASIEMFVAFQRRSAPEQAPRNRNIAWREISVLLLPTLACIGLLLLTPATFFALFDRYLLDIVPFLIIYLLGWHQEHVSTRIPRLAIAALVVISVLSIADTHDLFSAYRAQMRLTDELQKAGVPRTEIRDTFGFDMTTQLYAWGYINDPRMKNPPGAYKPQPKVVPLWVNGVACEDLMQPIEPALHARYELTEKPSPCLTATSFPSQSYLAWLPPFKREVLVGRILSAENQQAAVSK